MSDAMKQVEDEVRESNATFYRAFRDRNLDAMHAIWSGEHEIVCIHPGMDPLLGRDAVLDSWRGILGHDEAPRIQCTDVRVQVVGTVAYVTCLEGTAGDPPSLVATNLFVREDGTWRMMLHHAGPLSSRARREPLGETPDPTTLN
jgi:ketosteroid isomerase-like protein